MTERHFSVALIMKAWQVPAQLQHSASGDGYDERRRVERKLKNTLAVFQRNIEFFESQGHKLVRHIKSLLDEPDNWKPVP